MGRKKARLKLGNIRSRQGLHGSERVDLAGGGGRAVQGNHDDNDNSKNGVII